MPLPNLLQLGETHTALHQALQVLRSVRLAALSPQPNSLHYSLDLYPKGASTGLLKNQGQLRLDFGAAKLTWQNVAGGEEFQVPLQGESQKSAFRKVLSFLEGQPIDLKPEPEKIEFDGLLAVEQETAQRLAQALWWAHELLSQFRSQLAGQKSPIALWPHHFDLSFLWFAQGTDESSDPHLNVGFSTGTVSEEPYFYFYAWPLPEGLAGAIPAAFHWEEGWGTPGGKLSWSKVVTLDLPENELVAMLLAAHGAVKDGW